MMRKFLIISILALCFILTACGNGLTGTWEGRYDGDDISIKFSGKSITSIVNSETIVKGTYSITGDKIEIIDNDGNIDVISFSRTKNTLTLEDEIRLTKK